MSELELEFALAPERLDDGSPEERAAFGLFEVRSAAFGLTEGYDSFIKSYRKGPLVSGFHAAEWLAWNWWRLRWEPRSSAADWGFAHRMSSIGNGYVWPNLEIWSDGMRTVLLSSPSSNPEAKPFRYVGAPALVVPSTTLEIAIDDFITRILGRLDEENVPETNLHRLWRDILTERSNPDVARRRRLEALLGRDPDAVDDDMIERLLGGSDRIGASGLDEVAASSAQTGAIVTATEFEEVARRSGHDACPRDAVRLAAESRLPSGPATPAWRLGALAASALRKQEGLGSSVIVDDRLAAMAGTRREVLAEPDQSTSKLSFALDANALASRIVIGSRWRTSRRFNLARLIGDRLIHPEGGLHPATRAYTYRQKMQRSFAAELLCPFEALDDMLSGDYSSEAQEEAAEHFEVSELTVRTLLVNHKRIERAELDGEFDAEAA